MEQEFTELNSLNLTTGWERLIRSHSSARFYFELSGNVYFKNEMLGK